jgi:hypothetical protein
MERLNLEIAPDVVAFVAGCLEGLGMADPEKTLASVISERGPFGGWTRPKWSSQKNQSNEDIDDR